MGLSEVLLALRKIHIQWKYLNLIFHQKNQDKSGYQVEETSEKNIIAELLFPTVVKLTPRERDSSKGNQITLRRRKLSIVFLCLPLLLLNVMRNGKSMKGSRHCHSSRGNVHIHHRVTKESSKEWAATAHLRQKPQF